MDGSVWCKPGEPYRSHHTKHRESSIYTSSRYAVASLQVDDIENLKRLIADNEILIQKAKDAIANLNGALSHGHPEGSAKFPHYLLETAKASLQTATEIMLRKPAPMKDNDQKKAPPDSTT